jgi:hypothetical protein
MTSHLIISRTDHRSIAITDIRIIPMVTILITATVLRLGSDSAWAMNTMSDTDTDMSRSDTDRLVMREAVTRRTVIREAVTREADGNKRMGLGIYIDLGLAETVKRLD